MATPVTPYLTSKIALICHASLPSNLITADPDVFLSKDEQVLDSGRVRLVVMVAPLSTQHPTFFPRPIG